MKKSASFGARTLPATELVPGFPVAVSAVFQADWMEPIDQKILAIYLSLQNLFLLAFAA
jgi:hypothetical protein